ncbi:MAG: hypothetical protein IPO51_13980 [Dehalococcoidia bacterium]|nr:hypothetical protein [Dehalococcoidia bacterium]
MTSSFPRRPRGRPTPTTSPLNTAFTTIQFDGSGYAIAGNSLHLTSVLAHLPPGGVNAISLNIGGAGGVTVGTGKLILSGNNAFTGDVVVTGGVLAAGSDTALGSAVGLTQVLDGATLQLTAGVDLGAEVIEVAGAGLDGDGALRSLGGTSALGQLRLMDATTIGVFAGTLIVDLLTQGTPGAGFTLVGGGNSRSRATSSPGPAVSKRATSHGTPTLSSSPMLATLGCCVGLAWSPRLRSTAVQSGRVRAPRPGAFRWLAARCIPAATSRLTWMARLPGRSTASSPREGSR